MNMAANRALNCNVLGSMALVNGREKQPDLHTIKPRKGSNMVTREQFCALIAPFVAESKVELYDVELNGRTFRVLVDRPEGVDVDTLGELASTISTALDRSGVELPDQMLLEVSSPGLERKLRTREHFRAQLNETIRLKLFQARDGVRRFEGVLLQASEDAIQLDVEGDTHEFRYDEISEAKRVFDFAEAFRQAESATEATAESTPDETSGKKSNTKKAGLS